MFKRKPNGLDKAEKEFDEAVEDHRKTIRALKDSISRRKPIDDQMDEMIAELRGSR